MSEAKPINQLLLALWRHIAAHRRRQLAVLLVLLGLSSLAEIVSIGAVLPLLGVLTQPQRLFERSELQPLIHWLGLTQSEQLMLPLTIGFAVLALFAGGIRLLALKRSIKLSFAVGADLSNEVYVRTLYQPFSVHIARNSSEIINGISIKTNEVIFYVVMPVLSFLNAMFMLLAILIILVAITPGVAAWAFGTFGLIYSVISLSIRKGRREDSACIAAESTRIIQLLQEGLGGVRDILIDRSQKTFAEMFRQSDANLRKAQGNNQFVSQSPRYVMEALGIATIATLAYLLTQQVGGIATAFPTLAALALGLQRMLPMAQQAYNAWATIHGAHGALQDTLLLLEQPMPAADQSSTVTPLPFQRAIAFQDYSFRYATTAPWVLRGLNLCIRKGARIGFIGSTGSGKSTLLDVIMGLLLSEHCHMSVDDQPITVLNVDEWRAHIAHVPQTVFLTDNSVAANIAFGSPDSEIDMSRVRQAAVQAKIANDIESWPSQYDTFVGERGVQLSGGQRQRIGIARALYKRADVIIFDEATSALDSATESAVMQSIDALDSGLTVLIIAHRLSTLRNCDCIYKLDAGAIVLEDAQQLLLAH